MSITAYVTKCQVTEVINRTAASGNTSFKVVFTPKKGTIDDGVDAAFLDPDPSSRFVWVVSEQATSGPAGALLTALLAAKASKTEFYLGFRQAGAAEGASQKRALGIITQPSATASTNTAFAVQPVVQINDPNGDPMFQSGVTVTATRTTGTDTLGGTATAVTDARGQAIFTNLKLTLAGGTHTDKLTFSATGFTSSPETSGIAVS